MVLQLVGWFGLFGWLVSRSVGRSVGLSVDLVPWHSYDQSGCDIIRTWEAKHYRNLFSPREDGNITNLKNIWFMY